MKEMQEKKMLKKLFSNKKQMIKCKFTGFNRKGNINVPVGTFLNFSSGAIVNVTRTTLLLSDPNTVLFELRN